jgi:hypothetical protein
MIYKIPEGQKLRNGINWNITENSKIILNIKLGNFHLYFRWRAKHVEGKRFIFAFDIFHPIFSSSNFPRIDFDTRTVIVGDIKFTWQYLQDFKWQI